ncbi:MAG: YdcF family protein [Gulosibacter sp.]|uniref:YdcF family protein n=1 Tax=Gulosibacter sp. TaxID=2817531 RepID=UPI003F91606C
MQSTGDNRRPRLHLWPAFAFGIVGITVLWIAAGVYFLRFPPVEEEPVQADAIVILGPADPLRTTTATQLIRQGYSDVLVVSVWEPPGERPAHLGMCDHPAEYEVHCFSPDPNETRGEAQAFGQLAEEHGWESVLIVTMRTHMMRAELYFARCFDGEIAMVNDDIDRPTEYVLSQFFYETGAFAKFALISSC